MGSGDWLLSAPWSVRHLRTLLAGKAAERRQRVSHAVGYSLSALRAQDIEYGDRPLQARKGTPLMLGPLSRPKVRRYFVFVTCNLGSQRERWLRLG
jgi:hypothetical protein